jgi:hypothetical protein
MSDQPPESGAGTAPVFNRRQSLALAAGILALGAGLGVPRAALAHATQGRFQMKFYRAPGEGGGYLQTVELSDTLSEYLLSSGGGRVQMKMYHAGSEELGAFQLPTAVRANLERLQYKHNPNRIQHKVERTP